MPAPRLLLICCALFITLCAPLAAQDTDLAEIKKSAESGNADAQFFLGGAYEFGKGVKEDQTEAMKWYRKAAEQGNANAQFSLGTAYCNGKGLQEDDKEAVKWFRKAADQGHKPAQKFLELLTVPWTEIFKTSERDAAEKGDPEAQFNLGRKYAEGKGVTQNYAESVKWYRKAADQGHAVAQYGLGLAYYNAKGVSQDYAEAFNWFRKAADQGVALAQSNLGVMYARGEGVPKDDVEAYAWYNLAAVTNETARKNRDSAALRLTPGARILGQQRTKEIQQEIENREIERLKKEDQKQREKIQKGA